MIPGCWRREQITRLVRAVSQEALARQVQSSRELGADGFVIFNLTEKLATEFLPPLRLGVSSAPPLTKP